MTGFPGAGPPLDGREAKQRRCRANIPRGMSRLRVVPGLRLLFSNVAAMGRISASANGPRFPGLLQKAPETDHQAVGYRINLRSPDSEPPLSERRPNGFADEVEAVLAEEHLAVDEDRRGAEDAALDGLFRRRLECGLHVRL